MQYNKVYFVEDNFLIDIEWSKILKPIIYPIKSFYIRIFVNLVYFLRLLFVGYSSLIIAPWGLFWIPALLNVIKIKKFIIISLSTDTFLSEKTINNKDKWFLNRLKYFLAILTYKEVSYYLYSSIVVKEQLEIFWVSNEKLFWKYDIWIMNQHRFNEWIKYEFNNKSKDFLFIWHYYISNQKRLDILIESFLMLKKEYSDIKLNVVWAHWEKYFWINKIKELSQFGIIFHWFKYDIDDIVKKCKYYVHPWECEAISTAVLECMLAWLITIVSNKWWEKEAVLKANKEFVVDLNVESFYIAMKKAILLDIEKKIELSNKYREVAKLYSIDNAKIKINNLVNNLLRNVDK